MSITSRIRKSPILITSILFVFIAGYLFPYFSEIKNQFFSASKVNVGTIAGYKVPYYPEYRALYDSMLRRQIVYRGHYEGIEADAHAKAWERLVLQYGFQGTYDALGIEVTDEERNDMMLGYDVPVEIQGLPMFKNPKTGRFDRMRYVMYWKRQIGYQGGKEVAGSFEKDLTERRRKEKLGVLIDKSTYTPKTIGKAKQNWGGTVSVRAVCIPYASIPNSVVRNDVSKKDKKAYYKDHKEEFVLEEKDSSRTMRYVMIPILPNNEEVKKVEQALENLKERFLKIKAKNAEAFARQHTDNQDEVVVQWKRKDVPEYIMASLSKLKKDKSYGVIGPVRQASVVVLYRYLGTVDDSSWVMGKKEPVYRFVKIERKVDVQGVSRNKTFSEASDLVRRVKHTKQWEQVAKEEYGLEVKELTVTLHEARRVGRGTARGVIRWLFDAKLHEFSPPIETKDGFYVVAVMTKEQKPGLLTLQQVEGRIERVLFNRCKIKRIKEKLEKVKIGDKSLHEIKRAYGPDAFIYENRVTFESNKIAGNNHTPRAIGAAFGLKVGQRTRLIEEEDCIVILERIPDEFEEEKAVQKAESKKKEEQVYQERKKIMKVIINLIEVDDRRFKFYK